jgi:predicted lipid-binding transport protein (Tim44 family)
MPGASRFVQFTLILAFALVSSLAVVSDADARRAGSFSSFGSRGTRTFSAPPATSTAPMTAAPIERTMTPQAPSSPQFNPQPGINAPRPGFFSGFGRSMIGGLLVGGLFGMLLGHGFGGGAGFLGMLLQIAIIVGGGMLLLRFFANRQQAGYAGPQARGPMFGAGPGTPGRSYQMPGASAVGGSAPRDPKVRDEIGLQQADLNRFEALLTQIQTAYGSEDYGSIRSLTTPEAMSYLAEELGENATRGVRNTVSQVKLLQGDVAEAWRENGSDYATLAMRYSSIDAMVDRNTGRVVDGDNVRPSESTELWTFVRKGGSDWKLSAIQGTELARQ